jgi:hypothetical protein
MAALANGKTDPQRLHPVQPLDMAFAQDLSNTKRIAVLALPAARAYPNV